jgi:purine-cytosine permease-like protein
MAVSAARNQQLRRYVENRHIDHIPAAARHGKPWHQFAFWFGGNVTSSTSSWAPWSSRSG